MNDSKLEMHEIIKKHKMDSLVFAGTCPRLGTKTRNGKWETRPNTKR
jgi:hypothetical protein